MNESATYEIKLKDSFSRPLGGLETKMNGFEGKVGGLKSSFNGLGDSITGAFAGGLVAGGIASLVMGLKDIAVGAVSVTREFTNLKEAIEFSSGKEAATNIKYLDDTIEQLGLDMKSTYTGFKTFEGALMGTTLEGEKGLKIFTAVSKASSVMKLSADATEGAFLALGQMISKGTVSAEELRGQLGERLPGAFQIAARAMGVNTSELGKMMQKGEIIAEDFLPKFAMELEKTFSPGVLKAQDSFNANMNRFSNFVLRAKLSIGNALIPALNEVISLIPKLDFAVINDQFKEFGVILGEITGVFHDMFDAVGINVQAFSIIQVVMQSFAGLIRTILLPIRAVVGFVKLVVDAIQASLPIFQEFGTLLKNIFTFNFDGASDSANKLGKLASDFKNTMGSAIDEVVSKEIEGWKRIFSLPGEAESAKQNNQSGALSSGVGGLSARKSGTTGSGSGSGIEKITAGTRNVTVNINKLLEVNNKNAGEMLDSAFLKKLQKALLTVVNDVNIVAQ